MSPFRHKEFAEEARQGQDTLAFKGAAYKNFWTYQSCVTILHELKISRLCNILMSVI